MAIALTPSYSLPPRYRFIIAITAVAAILLISANVWHDSLFHRTAAPSVASAPAETVAEVAKPAASATTVVLPEGKFATANIGLAPAARVELPTEVSVSGQVAANPDRLIDIRTRAVGVIRSVHGEIGTRVKQGDPLVVIDSADVGKANLDLRARRRELATARAAADWKREVAANVEAMLPLLRKNVPAKEIAAQFIGKPLGAFRATLLSGYADFEIARHEEEKQTDLFKKEIVGEHPYYLAIHGREGMQAKFEAELEQVRFDSAQQLKLAEQGVKNAEAAVIDAGQRLRLLGVTEDLAALLSPRPLPAATVADYEDVTRYTITAPFDGTILARTAAVSQRVELTDVLFTLVDPSTVRVQANIPESDMALLPTLKDAKVRVTAAAYPGRTFEATLLSVGSDVDPRTRTVALRASLPNPDGLLKLGLFVRITLDSTAKEDALTVPSGAVVAIDEKPGVFLPEKDPRTFRFHPVKAGRDVGGRRVVTEGLKEGDEVVSAGAFLLKSELILQNETDEE